MDNILTAHRPHNNKKYYLFMRDRINRFMNNPDLVVYNNVKQLLKDSPISRPTFYTYFSSAEEFYKDLMDIISKWLPVYMAEKSKELETDDFIEVAFNMKLGIIINNIKKAADQFPSLKPLWELYYRNANTQIRMWYTNTHGLDKEASQHAAKFVVNELILNCDKYYNNIADYRGLMLKQSAVIS